MCTEDIIVGLYCSVDDQLGDVPAHPQAALSPSEVVTLALLYALKGVGTRAFYRWLARDWRPLFPRLPERTRLFRLFVRHQGLTARFLAGPTVLGVADSYGIELLHPAREGRSPRQLGKKGYSNRRWIVGGKLAFVLNQWGLVCAWDCGTANVHDSRFAYLAARFAEEMIVLADFGFHAAAGDPSNLKICKPHRWGERMVVETVLSMLTRVCHLKRLAHRAWEYFRAHLAYALAAFNTLVQWHGLTADEAGFVHLSIAEFSL
jgi:hypothetical protein